jgi:hypothetical protein
VTEDVSQPSTKPATIMAHSHLRTPRDTWIASTLSRMAHLLQGSSM